MSSTPQPKAKNRPQRARIDRLVVLGLVVLFAFGVLGLAAGVGWAETWAQIRALGPLQLAILLGLSLVNYLLRGMRWHLCARASGLHLRLRDNLLHFIGGFAMTVTPGRIGELVRLRWISNLSGRPFERSLPLPFIDRVFDVAAMALVLAACAMLSQAGLAGALPVAGLALLVAVAITRPWLLRRMVTQLWRLVRRWPRRFAGLRQAARGMDRFSKPGLALPALVLGVIGWSAEGYALFLLLGWMGADIGFATATLIFVFSTLAGGLTGAPGGVGGAEAAMLALLVAQGVPLETAIPAMAVIRLTTLWFAILLGFCAFPIAERSSQKGARPHGLENAHI
ncbi:MAG: lysylphosphatidylglycerol synthase transmembrane domain-containing protein [Pseudomonadota bacterium]